MSTVFELDEAGWDQRVADARLSGFDANQELEATAGEGIFSGTGLGLVRGIPRMARAVGNVAAGTVGRALDVAGEAGDILDRIGTDNSDQKPLHTESQDAMFGAVERGVTPIVDLLTPSSRDVGVIGRTLGSFAEIAFPLVAGGGNPALLIGTSGIEGGTELVNQGVDSTTAVVSGTIDAATTAVGFKLPFLGKSLAGKMATGATGNVVLGAGATETQRELLKGRGYEELAENYDPLDAQSRFIDLLTGAAFGGIDYLGSRSERATILAAANAKHFQQDTAPGRPLDAAASVAHQRAMETALGQLLRGEPVSVDPAVAEANFAPRAAREFDPEMIREAIGDIPESQTFEQAMPEPLGDAGARNAINDIERLAVPENIRTGLRQMYETAARVKPVFDNAVREIVAEIGTPHDPVIPKTLKSAKRAVEKALADYGGDATKVKDVVRATIVADTPVQAAAAIEAAAARFGQPTKLRNLLDEGVDPADGYRDVNLNFNVEGHTVELQINLPEMVKAKKDAHKLYEERRSIEAKATGNAADRARILELDKQMKSAYAAAWKEALSRSKASEEISSPSSRGSLKVTGLPADTSQARTSKPPPLGSVIDTGTPSQSKNLGSLSKKATGDSSSSIIPDDGFESPTITAAKALLEQRDIQVPTGEIDVEGKLVTRSGREMMAQNDADIATAKRESVKFEAAVSCFLTQGTE